MPSLTLFSAFGVAGRIVVLLDGLSVPLLRAGLLGFLYVVCFFTAPVTRFQLVHRPLFPSCVYPSLPFWFQLAWLPLRLQGVLGQVVRQMLPGHLASASWHVAIPQGDFHLVHSPGLRPGHDLRSSFLPEEAVSEKRFIAVLGEVHIHSWCIIIVRHGGHVHGDFFCFLFSRFAVSLSSSNLFFSSFGASFDPLSWVPRDLFTRASIALGPSEGASLMHTQFPKWAFFKVSPIRIFNERFNPLCGPSPSLMLSSAGVCTIAARFSQVAQRHSYGLCRFSLLRAPSWWRRQLHVVCVTLYVWPPQLLLAKWRNLPGDSWCRFYVVQIRTVIFRQMPMISLLSSLAVLPTCYLPHDSRLLGLTLRPSAPVCCCHPVSWARGRLAFAQEAVRVSPSLSSRFSCSCWSLQGLSGSREKCLFMRCGNEMALPIREMVFGVSHIPGAYTVLDHFFWVRLAALKNHDVLLRCVWFHCLSTTNRRTSSRLVRCVTFAWAPMRFTFGHLHLLKHPLSHDRLGMPMEAILDTGGWFLQKRQMSRTGSSRLLIHLIFPFPEVRGYFSWDSKGVVACFLVTKGSTETRGFTLCSGTRWGTTASFAATTYMWTFGATFLLWCYIVRPQGSLLAQFWSVYNVE